ncbi:MAG: hypothetical protein ACLUF0_10080, partial [[Clostridium] symbiosum]
PYLVALIAVKLMDAQSNPKSGPMKKHNFFCHANRFRIMCSQAITFLHLVPPSKSSVIFWCPIRIPCIDAIGPKGQALTPACTTGAFLPCFWFPIPAMVFLSRRLPVAGVFV